MAVNLGKYPRHRQPSPIGKNIGKIPTRASVQEQPRAVDPGVAGGPTDVRKEMFDSGMGEAMQVFGAGLAESGIDQLIAVKKMEAKMRDDEEKNAVSITLDQAEASYDTLNEQFDWSNTPDRPMGEDYRLGKAVSPLEDYGNKFSGNDSKFKDNMKDISPSNRLDYEAKYFKIKTKASLAGATNQKTFVDKENVNRVQKKLNEFRVSLGGTRKGFIPDPSMDGFMALSEGIINDNKGSMTDEKARELLENWGIFSFQERRDYLLNPLTRGTDFDAIDEIQKLMTRMEKIAPETFNKKTFEATTDAIRGFRKFEFDQSKEGRELSAKMAETRAFQAEAKELRTMLSDKKIDYNQYREMYTGLLEAYGKSRVEEQIVKLSEGQKGFIPGVEKPVAEGDPAPTYQTTGEGETLTKDGEPILERPSVKTLPKDSGVLQINPDGSYEVTTFGSPDAGKSALLGDDQKTVKSGVSTEIRLEINDTFGFETDDFGKPIGMNKADMKFYVNFGEAISKGIRTKEYLSVHEAVAGEFNKLEAKDIPKKFSFKDAMDKILSGDIPGYSGGTTIIPMSEPGITRIEKDIKRGFKKIRLEDATGAWSWLDDALGSLFGSFIRGAVDPDVTRARFQYGLLVRDFVREFTLSPRFAVKEQELLRAMFPGPGFLNAPGQAAVAIREFQKELVGIIPMYKDVIEIAGAGDRKEKLLVLKKLRFVKGMLNRIDKFDLTGMETATVENPLDFGTLTPGDAKELALKDPEKFKQLTGESPVGSPSKAAPVVELPTATTQKETPPPEEEDPNANLRNTIQNINPDDIVSFANDFIKENPEDPAGAFIDTIKQIGESDIGDSILNEIRSLIKKPQTKTKKKKTSVKKKGKK